MDRDPTEYLRGIEDQELLIIKTHLIIENQIDDAINGFVYKPNILKIEKFNFAQKARLAGSLGIITKQHYDAVSYLNWIRNQMSHNLDHGIDEERVARFVHLIDIFKENDVHGYHREVHTLQQALVLLIGVISARRALYVELPERLSEEEFMHVREIFGKHED